MVQARYDAASSFMARFSPPDIARPVSLYLVAERGMASGSVLSRCAEWLYHCGYVDSRSSSVR